MKRYLNIFFRCVILIALLLMAFLLGRLTVPKENQNTFYATIENISGQEFLVKGLEVNDVNYRGEFRFSVDDGTDLIWHNTKISLSDFLVGDTVSISYSGNVAESDPAIIDNISKLILLNDRPFLQYTF